jgi:hypothetical protein
LQETQHVPPLRHEALHEREEAGVKPVSRPPKK